MDRLFLDANVLFSAAYLPASPLRRLWELDAAELLTSGYAAAESYRNLSAKRPQQLTDLARLLDQVRLVWDAVGPLSPSVASHLPAKDRPILQAAIAARVTHLLTGDKQHFGSLFGQSVLGVLVLTPGEYLRLRCDA